MGEEYAETAPFPYFISHGDAELVAAVRRGRAEEFAEFVGQGHPPDPQSAATFLSAKLHPEERHGGAHHALFAFYTELIRLRKEYAPLTARHREALEIVADAEAQVLAVRRPAAGGQISSFFNYSGETRVIHPPLADGTLHILLDSSGHLVPGSRIIIKTSCPETFLTLAPFGVIVYRQR
jgi:maltooligosyltrehalose trehalohydrolase